MDVKVTWFGHANFLLEADGVSILVDPFFTGNPTAPYAWQQVKKVDLVLVTHMHGDHSGDAVEICKRDRAMLGSVVGISEKFVELGLPGELVLNGIGFNIGGSIKAGGAEITMTEAFHTSEAGSPVGFIIKLPGGFTIYHAGDTGIFRNMETWGELFKIDLALLPAGGLFTMDARQAALAARYLKAAAVIPMHWGTFPVLAGDMESFPALLENTAPGCRAIVLKPGDTISF